MCMGLVGGLTMDMKTMINGLTEAEAKAALVFATRLVVARGSCFDCFKEADCSKNNVGTETCEIGVLQQILNFTAQK